jgi:hypothetical protein
VREGYLLEAVEVSGMVKRIDGRAEAAVEAKYPVFNERSHRKVVE